VLQAPFCKRSGSRRLGPYQRAEIEEAVEIGEMVEVANIHAIFMHVAEKMVG
jgi:hypothetical protein